MINRDQITLRPIIEILDSLRGIEIEKPRRARRGERTYTESVAAIMATDAYRSGEPFINQDMAKLLGLTAAGMSNILRQMVDDNLLLTAKTGTSISNGAVRYFRPSPELRMPWRQRSNEQIGVDPQWRPL